MAVADYTRVYPIYGGVIVDVDLPTVNPFLILAKNATRAICLQRAVFVPTQVFTGTLQFYDSLSGKIIAQIQSPSSAMALGQSSFQVDYGPRGTACSVAANLVLGIVGTAVGRLHLEAFQKGR